MFLATTKPELAGLRRSLADGDTEAARVAAHSATGAARTAGATELGGICGAIEDALVRGDQAAASESAGALDGALERLESAIVALGRPS